MRCDAMQNVLMGTLDVSGGKGIIGVLEEYLSSVLRPALKAIPNWGELEKSPSGKKLSRAFIDTVDNFIGSLHGLLHRHLLTTVEARYASQTRWPYGTIPDS